MSEAWNIRFGTAGTSDSFAAQGYKSSLDVPEYTAKMGLNAFEYQCGRGVCLGLDKAPAWLPLLPSGTSCSASMHLIISVCPVWKRISG